MPEEIKINAFISAAGAVRIDVNGKSYAVSRAGDCLTLEEKEEIIRRLMVEPKKSGLVSLLGEQL